MGDTKFKVGYGSKPNIDKILETGVIDEGDMIVTKDTHELAFVNPQGETIFIQSKNKVYGSKEEAIESINSLSETYAGQTISVKNDKDMYDTYIVNSNSDGTYDIKISGGSGENEEFERKDTTMATVGGLKSGTSLEGMTAMEVLEAILFPYVKPNVSVNITPSTTLYENGSEISNILINAVIEKKSKNITYVKFFVDNKLVYTVTDNVSNGGTINYMYSDTINKNTTFKVEISDGQSVCSSSKEITFTNYTYWGALKADISEIVESKIISQNKKLVNNKSTTCSFTTENQMMFYAIPQSFGNVTKFTDVVTNYELNDWKSTNITINNVKYIVYYSGNGQVTDYNIKFN